MIELVFQPDEVIQLAIGGCRGKCNCYDPNNSKASSTDSGNED